MIKIVNLQKKKLFYYLLFFLVVTSCGKNKNPGLSDKELFSQKETTDTTKLSTNNSDTATYVVPPGIKFKESRAIDPANPPVVLDIAKGNFLLDAKWYASMENGAGRKPKIFLSCLSSISPR